jgi:hypothetical protein
MPAVGVELPLRSRGDDPRGASRFLRSAPLRSLPYTSAGSSR